MIRIVKCSSGDTRTAAGEVSFEEFERANDLHKSDVRNVMNMLAGDIEDAGREHDRTKKRYEKVFYEQFMETLRSGKDDFKEKSWYQEHIRLERHHLNDHVPDDVDLIDVLEMISDCVCAGLARSGSVREIKIDPEVLEKAVENTAKYIESQCIVVEEKDEELFFV